jgi:polyhydroxyalkanoate synthase
MQEALKKPKLQQSLEQEAKNRSCNLLKAVLKYIETPYARTLPEPPCIWRKGNARLLDYGTEMEKEAKTIALFVPSLINRYYILDLEKERSMMRYIATQGIHPIVLDWGTPGDLEKEFSTSDYIQQIMLPAIDFLYQTGGMPITLGGYCMGGVFSLAAAQLRPKKIKKIALLATPWNFHCKAFSPFIVDDAWQSHISSMLHNRDDLPADIVQALFYITDPFVFEHKFLRYAVLDPESRQAKDFIALEHWVNDGVPMTSAAAHDTLLGWAQNNQLHNEKWMVSNKKISPKKITQPVFMAIPKNDHIVPFDCAMPLAQALPHAKIIHPSAGHVGMIVGSHARRELWQPLAEWMLQRSNSTRKY